MPRFEVLENLARWAGPALFRVLQALTDTFSRISSGGDVKQPLIGFGVLHNGRGLPFHREHYGPLGLFQLLHEVAGPPPEGSQRLNIFGDI